MLRSSADVRLYSVLTLWLPLSAMLILFGAAVWSRGFYLDWFAGETGLLESLQVVILVVAAGYVVSGLADAQLREDRAALGWFALLLLGLVYMTGEEASWGQHWFGWSTPDWFGSVNDQGETNLHNTSSWLDQKPRLLLELAVIYTGILRPLVRRLRGSGQSAAGSWFWPTAACIPTAILSVIARLPDRTHKWFDTPLGDLVVVRNSEVQELYFYWFILLYVIVIRAWFEEKPARVAQPGG